MSLLAELLNEGSEEDLKEGADRAYKRDKQTITRYFRCNAGPKKGKLTSDPSKCGTRPDPKKVRHGRKVARQKGAIRVRKTINAKKQHISKRVTSLNKAIRDRGRQTNHKMRESMELVLQNLHCLLAIREFDEPTIDKLIEYFDAVEVETLQESITKDNIVMFIE